MSRKKHISRKPVPAQPTISASARPLLGGIVIVAIAAVLVASWSRETRDEAPRRYSSHPHAAVEATEEDFTRLVERSVELKPEISTRIHEIASGIPEAERLVEFFDRYAVASIVSPMGGIMVSSEGIDSISMVQQVNDGPHFMIVEATLVERERAGLSSLQHWQYSGSLDVLYAPPGLATDGLFVAAAYLHELQHGYDLNMGIEPSPPNVEEWYDGELRAYHVELAVLDRHTGNRFTACIRTELERYPSDRFLGSSFLPRMPPCVDELLGPSRSDAEATARGGLVYVALNLEIAEAMGGSQEDRRAAIADASPYR